MSKLVGDVMVKFTNEKELFFTNCEEYGYMNDCKLFFVTRYGHRIFFNPDIIQYIGRVWDLNNNEPKY